ncbi:hypothetical protein [Aliikangiella sp. IMCC44359]|uniref:hypothetical protein n=1 Tax=Aliikangiella sp. IMCC44359 TaxID=3459125 RepID=UPI00403B233B
MERAHQCPECSNTYSTKFQNCPECNITLVSRTAENIQTQSGGTGNIAIQGNNNHTEVTKQYGYQNETVSYQIDIIRTYSSSMAFYRTPITLGIIILIAILSIFADISSIVNNFGITVDNFPVKLGMIILATLLSICYVISIRSIRAQKTTDGQYCHKNYDGKIYIVRAKAKCPVKGCSGQVTLVHSEDDEFNELSDEVIGVCNNHPNRHLFEFNIDTKEGVRIDPASI